METIEWDLLSNKPSLFKDSSPRSHILQGSYASLLKSESASPMFHFDTDSIDIDTFLKNLIPNFFKNSQSSTPQLDALCIAIACLNAFVQESWTGPPLDFKVQDLFSDTVVKFEHKKLLELLSVDNEEVYSLTSQPLLLLIAITIFNSQALGDLHTLPWWRYRVHFTQQRILENSSATLHDLICSDLELISAILPTLENATRDIHCRYHMEVGMVFHWYKNDAKAKEQFMLAQQASLLEWSVTGALGKRTKFQTFDVSQLIIYAKSYEQTESNADTTKKDIPMPNTLDLNDEVLLESISLTKDAMNINENVQKNLRPLDQCILLAYCLDIRNTNPADGLTTEQMSPFVNRVLENPNNWMVHTMALLLRTRLEANRSRTVERSALQLQALVDQFSDQESSTVERMAYFFCISLPSKWEMERELGERFVSLGAVRSAMDIFNRLEMWEDVVSCHQMLQEEKKAEAIVLRLLQTMPKSPKLHCILGDLKGDAKYYEMAWSLSECRYSRSMRSLGAYYFKKEEFSKSIECYHNALAINPMYANSWFAMGCAAMRIKDWTIALKAFGRVTSMDNENGEAWNNMASVFIKEHKKKEAWRCLREALKSKFDASNIWENYLFVSIDLGEFSEGMRAMEKVLELRVDRQAEKRKVVDIEVLSILVEAVSQNKLDANNEPSKLLSAKLSTLLDTINSKISDPDIYMQSSKFYESNKQYKKAIEFCSKAYRAMLHNPYLLENHEIFVKTVKITIALADTYINLGHLEEKERMGEDLQIVCKDWQYQARTSLKTLAGRTKANYENDEAHELLLKKLQQVMEISISR